MIPALAAKVAALSVEPTSESASETTAGAPPTGSVSGSDSAAGAKESEKSSPDGSPPAALTPEAEAQSRHALLEEKLSKLRDENRARREAGQSKRELEQARKAREEAEADRSAIAKEKDTLTRSLRTGTFLETVKALGKDPAAAFKEMQDEAVRSGTPEFMIERAREDFKRQMDEVVTPLQKRIDELEAEKKKAEEGDYHTALVGDFNGAVQGEGFASLREEYEPAQLFGFVRHLHDNPQVLFAHAKALGVRLTNPASGFNMQDILHVLKAQQDAHEAGKAKRRAGSQASSTATQPTVNGTAERRNAGTTAIGNDLATATATGGKPPELNGMSAHARIQARIRKLGG